MERSSATTDDQLFMMFAIGLTATVATLIAFAYYMAGVGAPSPLFIAEHLAIGLGIRAAYKSCDGSGFIHHFTLGLLGRSSEDPGAQAPLLEWNEALHLGVPSIDEQHQKLVIRANAVAEALATDGAEARLPGLFEDFLAYSEMHSKFEQALFEEHSLAGALEHRAEHENLIAQAREFFASLASAETANRHVTEFLSDWLSDHVSKGDKAFAEQLRSRGIA